MVKNLPCNAGVTDSIPGMRTKIPHAQNNQTHVPQLENPCAAMKDPTSCKSDLMQPNKQMLKNTKMIYNILASLCSINTS